MKTPAKLPAAQHARLIRFFLCGDISGGAPATYVALVEKGYVAEVDRRPVLTAKGREYAAARRAD